MSEDNNLHRFRRQTSYFDRRAHITNHHNAPIYFPQACSRTMYPDSFVQSGVYLFGAQNDTPQPNWDTSDAQPINWDKPVNYYVPAKEFYELYNKNERVIHDASGNIPLTKPPTNWGGYKSVTGYRKPSIANKQIWLAEEKYMNDY